MFNILFIIPIFILILYILNTKTETYKNSLNRSSLHKDGLYNQTLSYNEFKYKYIHTPTKNKIIPKIVFRTGPFKLDKLPSVVQLHLDKLIKNNPDYIQVYFDDDDCRNFIKEFFPQYLPEYDILIPTAFKADLWRLLVIYKYGGIYNDLGHYYITPISDIVTKTDQTVLCIDDNIHPYPALYNAFFATYPENKIIKHLIIHIINNIRNRIYGTHSLSITGPYAWGIAITDLLNKPSNSKIPTGTITIHNNETITFVQFSNCDKSIFNTLNIQCIITKFPDYYKIMYNNRNVPHYGILWYNNQVYNDTIQTKLNNINNKKIY
jgi:hypothetical protein